MQITNSEVCDRVNVRLYKEIKAPLVGENAFPLTGFVCMTAHDIQSNKKCLKVCAIPIVSQLFYTV